MRPCSTSGARGWTSATSSEPSARGHYFVARLKEKEVSLRADPCAAGFFMRALETNEHNFAALTNIVYCNQKVRLLS